MIWSNYRSKGVLRHLMQKNVVKSSLIDRTSANMAFIFIAADSIVVVVALLCIFHVFFLFCCKKLR